MLVRQAGAVVGEAGADCALAKPMAAHGSTAPARKTPGIPQGTLRVDIGTLPPAASHRQISRQSPTYQSPVIGR